MHPSVLEEALSSARDEGTYRSRTFHFLFANNTDFYPRASSSRSSSSSVRYDNSILVQVPHRNVGSKMKFELKFNDTSSSK